MNWLNRLRSRWSDGAFDDDSRDPEVAHLLERARNLPVSQEPQRDLFLGIQNRIADCSRVHAPARWSPTTMFPRPLAALSVGAMLVVTTAFSVLWVVQPSTAPPSDSEVAAIAQRLRERDGVSDVHRSVVAILEAHRARLPLETVVALEENLRSIDRAIAEIHLALESNPNHHALSFLLAEAYQREADLLERIEWWMRSTDEVQS